MAGDSRLYSDIPVRVEACRTSAPLNLRRSMLAYGLLLGAAPALLPTVGAAFVESVPCPGQETFSTGGGIKLEQIGFDVRMLSPGQFIFDKKTPVNSTTLEAKLDINFPNVTSCTDIPARDWDALVHMQRPGTSKTSILRQANFSCKPSWYPEFYPGVISTSIIEYDVGPLEPLPSFALDLSLGPLRQDQVNSSFCLYFEVMPVLGKGAILGLRLGPIAIFTLVLIAGVLATLYSEMDAPPGSLHRRWTSVDGISPSRGSNSTATRPVLPGVGDCLLHLQFIFLMGALTVHYPPFYQPVTSQLSWAALFSPIGPLGVGQQYTNIRNGIYEINGTLSGGTFGFELLTQITGGPMRMDIWWNMVILAVTVALATALLLQIPRILPSIRDKFTSTPSNQPPPPTKLTATRTAWNVIKVVSSYFLTPIVALSAYQLCNLFLPVYHLVLASLFIVAVVICFIWMSRVAPRSQLGNLLVGGTKSRYRVLHQRDNSGDRTMTQPNKPKSDKASEVNLFTMMFFAVAFIRGITIGGLQLFPLAQIATLGAMEMVMFISTMFLRPFATRDLVISAGTCLARFAVVMLTVVFLSQLNAKFQTKISVGYVILGIHTAVLVFGCAIPAILRLIGLARSNLKTVDGKHVYGLDRLHRRSTTFNNLSQLDVGSDHNGSLSHSPHLVSPASVHSPHPSIGKGSRTTFDSRRSGSQSTLRPGTRDRFFREPRAKTSLTSLNSSYSPNSPVDRSKQSSEGERDSLGPLRKATTLNLPTAGHSSRNRRHSSASILSDGTLVDASEPPLPLARPALAPRWGDYSFREADLYYRQPPAYEGANEHDWSAAADSSSSNRQEGLRSLSAGVSVWAQLTGSKTAASSGGGGGGFEVRRPPRPVPEQSGSACNVTVVDFSDGDDRKDDSQPVGNHQCPPQPQVGPTEEEVKDRRKKLRRRNKTSSSNVKPTNGPAKPPASKKPNPSETPKPGGPSPTDEAIQCPRLKELSDVMAETHRSATPAQPMTWQPTVFWGTPATPASKLVFRTLDAILLSHGAWSGRWLAIKACILRHDEPDGGAGTPLSMLPEAYRLVEGRSTVKLVARMDVAVERMDDARVWRAWRALFETGNAIVEGEEQDRERLYTALGSQAKTLKMLVASDENCRQSFEQFEDATSIPVDAEAAILKILNNESSKDPGPNGSSSEQTSSEWDCDKEFDALREANTRVMVQRLKYTQQQLPGLHEIADQQIREGERMLKILNLAQSVHDKKKIDPKKLVAINVLCQSNLTGMQDTLNLLHSGTETLTVAEMALARLPGDATLWDRKRAEKVAANEKELRELEVKMAELQLAMDEHQAKDHAVEAVEKMKGILEESRQKLRDMKKQRELSQDPVYMVCKGALSAVQQKTSDASSGDWPSEVAESKGSSRGMGWENVPSETKPAATNLGSSAGIQKEIQWDV
ncbi:hypothetical protein PspLS_04116 [Pyricularia sp. CBS 133598]|nr:hypothetical protein PspLS_04116 [Pyricularia sp. CBS 133598]